MVRPLRIEYAGALYHVTSRGNRRELIYQDDDDRQLFLAILGGVVGRFKWVCHAYCLMGNHYHLLIETIEPNLSAGMRQLNQVYTQRYNRRHHSVGHVFQGRFKAVLVEKEPHLLAVCRYVVLNPVRAGLVVHPKQWPWSSYAATAGMRSASVWLTTAWVLAQFGERLTAAQQAYREFVREGIGEENPLQGLHGGLILGAEAFAVACMGYLQEDTPLEDIPQYQAHADRPALQTLFSKAVVDCKARRNERIVEAHLQHRYTMREIGKTLGLSLGMISRIVKAAPKV
jgi:putative transposase